MPGMKAVGFASAVIFALLPAGAYSARSTTGLHGYVWIEQTPQCRAEPCEDPVPGAKVVALAGDGRRVVAVTNARGFYRLVLGAGRYSVEPSEVPAAQRSVSRRVLVRSGGDGRLDFHLLSQHQ
jgi:hypothetical protein